MKKLLVPVVLLALLMVVTWYVKRKQQTALTTDQPVSLGAEHAGQLYVEVSALANLDYFYDHQLGMKLAGQCLGVQTDYVGPSDYDMEAMVNAFEQTLARPGLKGIVVVGFEDGLIPVINKAVERGIPVVTVDADLPTSQRLAFVGTGNYQAGYQGGQRLAEMLGRQGKVAILTKPGQSNLETRVRGYREALGQCPGIRVVQVADTQSDPNVAAQAAAAVLERHNDLAALVCVEAAGGLGAATAVKERGLKGKVLIMAMDRGNDILKLIDEGVIQATVAQKTALMPFYAVQILYHYHNNPVPVTVDNKRAGVQAIPTSVDIGVMIVDKSNCRLFLRN